MSLTQLQADIKAAYDAVSNNPNIDPAVARQTLANDVGTAVQTYLDGNGVNGGNLVLVRDSVVDLIAELRKLKVDIGNNLSSTVLNSIESDLNTF